MHIEPGIVDGTKIVLSYATAVGVFGLYSQAGMGLDQAGRSGSARRAQSDRCSARVLFLRGAPALSDWRVRSSSDSGVDALSYVRRCAGGHRLGARIADTGRLLRTVRILPQYGMNVTTRAGAPVRSRRAGSSHHSGEYGLQGCDVRPVSGAFNRLPGRRGGLGCLLGDLWPGMWVPLIWRISGRSVSPT